VLRNGDGETEQANPQSRIAANDAFAVYRLARAGAGVAVTPDFLAAEDVAAGHMRALLPDWRLESLDVFAEWPAHGPKGGAAQRLVDALAQSAGGARFEHEREAG